METAFRIVELLIQLLKILAWPIVALFVLYVLKDAIRDLIRRIKRIGYDKAGIDTIPSNNTQLEKTDSNPIELLTRESSNENIEKALAVFRPETIDYFKAGVTKETELESLNTSEERESVLFRYSQALYLILHFNRIHHAIYGSQLDLMQALNGSSREDEESLKVFYDIAVKNNPKLYAGYSYKQYLDFLYHNKLILREKSGTVKITILGRDFLKFLIEMGLTTEKNN